MVGYKLFRVRKDGTLGSLFINKKEVLPIGEWIKSKSYPTKSVNRPESQGGTWYLADSIKLLHRI